MTGEGTIVVALVRDLMDRSRIGVLSGSGVDVCFVRSVEALGAALPVSASNLPPSLSAPDVASGLVSDVGSVPLPAPVPAVVVVVDLSRPDALEAIAAGASAGARVVAYGSHVDRDGLDAARAAGAEVLARSAFFTRLPDLTSP